MDDMFAISNAALQHCIGCNNVALRGMNANNQSFADDIDVTIIG